MTKLLLAIWEAAAGWGMTRLASQEYTNHHPFLAGITGLIAICFGMGAGAELTRWYDARQKSKQHITLEGYGSQFDGTWKTCSYDHSTLKMYGPPCPECGIVQGSDMK